MERPGTLLEGSDPLGTSVLVDYLRGTRTPPPGSTLAPVLGQHRQPRRCRRRDQFPAQPLAKRDGVGAGHHPFVGVGAKTSAAVHRHPVRPGLHVEGQRPDGGDTSAVVLGR
ncbi:MAG: hypothetical protein ABSE77_16970 [Acidimicrobiales bacterium]